VATRRCTDASQYQPPADLLSARIANHPSRTVCAVERSAHSSVAVLRAQFMLPSGRPAEIPESWVRAERIAAQTWRFFLLQARAHAHACVANLAFTPRRTFGTSATWVILAYDEQQAKFNVQTADPTKLASLLAGRFDMPILLDEFDYKLDDEFARRVGVAMLNLLALGKPELKPYMSVTPGPIPRPEDGG